MININTPMFLIRFNLLGITDAIERHIYLLNENGYVWLMKRGRKAVDAKLNRVLCNGGFLVLKEPKNSGDRYFLCTIDAYQNSKPDENDMWPEYYNKYSYNAERTQWFRIRKMRPLETNEINSIVFDSNNERVTSVINHTSTAFMFVHNDIEWNEVVDNE